MVALTIGMATYNDFDGVYFTIEALRLYHDLSDTELLVIDNFGCEHTRRFVEGLPDARYILATDVQGTAAPRDLVFREARGEAVLCCDSHVVFAPGAIARLRAFYRDHPGTCDLLQGPLVYDDLRSISTHFEPVWREQMWGIWATDQRGLDPDSEPFEIPMQGLGAFSCRKAAWPGFNPAFRGFGGEEGYLHEKFRQRGGRCLCLPWLRWVHRFGRPSGVPYPLTIDEKFRNYIIGHTELGLDLAPVRSHFAEFLREERLDALTTEALRDSQLASLPLISCICPTSNRVPERQYLVEEAIESFLRQSYPRKELIVLNDCPGQELVCDAPGVRVVNVPTRFASLGEKYNAGIALARGDLIANWDDDDISLPWRLSLSVELLGDADAYNPGIFWFMRGGVLQRDAARNVGHNFSLFRRTAFDAVGGYPAISLGVDQAMEAALRAKVVCQGGPNTGQDELTRDDWYYIYRWGVSPNHLSGSADTDFWQRIGKLPVQTGRFELRPLWRMDYSVEARRLASEPIAKCKRGQEGKAGRKRRRTAGDHSRSAPRVVLLVVGDAGRRGKSKVRGFPRIEPNPGEAPARHLDRVMRAIDQAIVRGGTHLLVPRENAEWLADHPLLASYFAAQHELIEASPKLGIVFALARKP